MATQMQASQPSLVKHKKKEKEYDETCETAANCAYLKRMCKALKFYQSNDESNYTELLNYFSPQHYNLLLTDYHHILNDHLEHKSLIEIQTEFEHIHTKIMDSIGICSLDKCNKLKRNHRNRERSKTNMLNTDARYNAAEDGHIDNLADAKIRFYMDTLDTIHCYFVHSYDIGFRLKLDEIKTNDDHNNDKDKDEIENYNLYTDYQMKQLRKTLNEKRKRLSSIRGMNRMQHNKFLTKMDSDSETETKTEAETKSNTSNSATQANDAKDSTFSFGHKHYYWKYYKNNDEIETNGANEGFPYKYWYIVKKYDSLKEELLSNKILSLSLEEFCQIQFEASLSLQSKHCRQNMISTSDTLSDRYNIEDGSRMKLENIIVIILYCDYDQLSFEFSKTFRKINRHESYESLKERNAEYWHWSKILRETVECFGTYMMDSPIDVYYHGVSYLLLHSFVSTFCAPTSTTCQISVATTFAADGLILELCMDDGRLSFFNCAWLSCYANEDERLFFGGFKPLRFKSVRWMKTEENYHLFIKSFALFNYVITSDYPLMHERKLITKLDYKIIQKLIKNEGLKIFPKYVMDIWKAFCLNQEVVKIRVEYLKKYYQGFKALLIHKDISNFILLYDLCVLFRNCKKIVIDFIAEKTYTDNNMSMEFTSELFRHLLQINEAVKKGMCSLNTIQLKYVKYNNLTPDKDFLDKHEKVFNNHGWNACLDGKNVMLYSLDYY